MPGSIIESFFFSLFFPFSFFSLLLTATLFHVTGSWEAPKGKAFRSIWNRREREKGKGREGKRKIKRGNEKSPPLSSLGNSKNTHLQQKEGV